jgi:hypothetical protein
VHETSSDFDGHCAVYGGLRMCVQKCFRVDETATMHNIIHRRSIAPTSPLNSFPRPNPKPDSHTQLKPLLHPPLSPAQHQQGHHVTPALHARYRYRCLHSSELPVQLELQNAKNDYKTLGPHLCIIFAMFNPTVGAIRCGRRRVTRTSREV